VAIAGSSENSPDGKANSVQSSCPSSEQAEIYIKQGIESAKKQDYVHSIQAYTESIKLCDKNAFAYYNRANSYTNIHAYNNAINDYKKAINLEPTVPDAFNNLCYVYNVQGFYKFAVDNCDEAIKLTPQANFFMGRANAYFKLGYKATAMRSSAGPEST
jgi:tetratricopeptide (TPR) repeat protein